MSTELRSCRSFRIASALTALALATGAWATEQAPAGNLAAQQPSEPEGAAVLGSWMSPEEESLLLGGAYSSPLVVPAAGFTSDGFNADSYFFSFGGGYLGGNAQAYGCVVAPAYLPNGVTVTDLFVTVFDNDAGGDISVSLRRVGNFDGVGSTMATAVSSGAFNGVQTISDGTITNPLVVYPDYSYYLTTCVQSSTRRIFSARLYYTQ